MADRTEKILLQIELDLQQTLVNLEKEKKALSDFKTEAEQLNKSLDDLKKSGKDGTATFTNLERQLIANKAAQQNSTASIREYEKALRNAVAANDAGAGSINQLKSQLSILTSEWGQLQATNRENTDEGKAVAAAMDLTTQKLKEQEASIGNARRNVGNYTEGFKTWRTELMDARNEAKKIIESFGAQSNEANAATKKVAELTDKYELFTRTTKGIQEGGKFEAIARTAAGLAGGITAAQGAMVLFGGESEDVHKALLKIQATIALMEGLKAFSKLGKDIEVLLPLLGLTKTKTQEVAIANQELSVAEGEAAVGAQATGVAMNSMLGPLGLILIAGTAVTAMLETMGDHGKAAVEGLIKAIEGENNAHKLTVDQLKIKNQAQITEAENALNLAKQKKESAQNIFALEQNLSDAKEAGLKRELIENQQHLDELFLQQKKNKALLNTDLSEDNLKKVQDNDKTFTDEIQATQNHNLELLNEHKKLQADIILVNEQSKDAQLQEQNELSQLKIATIRDDQARELANIQEAGNEKLKVIKDGEANAEQKRILIAKETAQKIKETNLKFDFEELQERNKLSILLTKEGSLERLAAELNAIKSEGAASLALIIGNGKVAQAKRLELQAETNDKLAKLEQDNLQKLNDIATANADNLLSILNEQSALFLEEKFKQLAAQERAEIDAAGQNGQDITLIEAKFHKQRLDAENGFNEARIKASEDLRNKLTEAAALGFEDNSEASFQLQIQKDNEHFEQERAAITRHQQQKTQDAKDALATALAVAGTDNARKLQAEQDYQDALKQIDDTANLDIEIATQNHLKNLADITSRETGRALDLVHQFTSTIQEFFTNLAEAAANADDQRLAALEESGNAQKEELERQLEIVRIKKKGALTEEEKQEIKLSQAIKEIDKNLAEERKKSQKKQEDDRKSIQKAAAVTDFILETAKIIVNTAEAVAKIKASAAVLLANPITAPLAPVALAQIPLVIASAAIEEAVIGSQLAKVSSLKEGGYTGDGNPSDVSTKLGPKPYTYHKQEYVIPDPVLKMPAVKSFVSDVIEPLRQNKMTSISATAHSFLTGGFSDITTTTVIQPLQVIQQSPLIDMDALALKISEANKSLPPGVVIVEDINSGQERVATVKGRADIS